jgi:hypothetical protein
MRWQDIIATQNVPAPRRRRDDPEAREQMALVQALRLAGIRFNAQHNGLHLSKSQAGKAKAMGTEKGCPDLLIFDAGRHLVMCRESCGWSMDASIEYFDEHTGRCRECEGAASFFLAERVAIELKAPDLKPKTDRAGRFSGAEPHQREWLEALESRGWVVFVAYGCDDALMKLRELGYGV